MAAAEEVKALLPVSAAAAVNPRPHSVQWIPVCSPFPHGGILLAASERLLVVDDSVRSFLARLNPAVQSAKLFKHTSLSQSGHILWISPCSGAQIRCCHVLASSTGDLSILAGTSDGRVLSFCLPCGAQHFCEPTHKWTSPVRAAIMCIDSVLQHSRQHAICCCDAEGSVHLLGESLCSTASVHLTAKQKAITTCISHVPWCDDALIVACGCADGAVRLVFFSPMSQACSVPVSFAAHSDWVKSVDFCCVDGQLVLLSGSQDSYIRIWLLSQPAQQASARTVSRTSLLHGEATIELPPTSVVCTRKATNDGLPACVVTLDGLVLGHDDWVTCVKWDQQSPGAEFVSCSADKSAILWSKHDSEWMPSTRLGGVGGKSVGMLGCALTAAGMGRRLFTYGHEGVLQTWRPGQMGHESWVSRPIPCGHTGQVAAFAVNAQRSYLMSVSSDQTARVWAGDGEGLLAEAGRPVSHGYSLIDAQFVPSSTDDHQFVLASAEKVARVFSSTQSFLTTLGRFPSHRHMSDVLSEDKRVSDHMRAESAVVPELSLSSLASNSEALHRSADEVMAAKLAAELQLKRKALARGSAGSEPQHESAVQTATADTSSGLQAPAASGHSDAACDHPSTGTLWLPPSQEELVDASQWIETHKLYHHGNDLSCLAVCPGRSLVLSAGVARSEPHAAVAVWHSTSWKRLQSVSAHSSTVNCISVSPSETHFVTGGKDRQLAVYSISDDALAPVQRTAVFRAHKREVYATAWLSNECFLSASKDGQVKIWTLKTGPSSDTVLSGGSVLWSGTAPVVRLAVDRQPSNSFVAISTANGLLLVLKVCLIDGHIVQRWQTCKALSGSATALQWFEGSLFIGCDDGCIFEFASPVQSRD